MSKQLFTNLIFHKHCPFRKPHGVRHSKLLFNVVRYNSEQNTKVVGAYSDENSKDRKPSWADNIIYNTFLEKYRPPRSWRHEANELWRKPMREAARKAELYNKDVPIALKYLEDDPQFSNELSESEENIEVDDAEELQFPYRLYTSFDFDEKTRSHGFRPGTEERRKYSNEEHSDEEDEDELFGEVQCGSANPDIPPSSVPCGGCGAFLHCQDTGIPGFMPVETFTAYTAKQLRGEICQRCYNLKHHNAALNVNISPDMYPKILSQIEQHRAVVLLVVDLLDFPCSVWPNLVDIIGTRRPVILVGNKVDLLPRDSKSYLDNVHYSLENVIRQSDLGRANIIGTELISATTGFGIERLISRIYRMWTVKGGMDIFIMGCTNVGKSSLFNMFLQSDLCKVQVADLVQRATISPWPGTTLNLLKFPVLNASRGWRKYYRELRLKKDEAEYIPERDSRLRELKITKDPIHATLKGKVGTTFIDPDKMDAAQQQDELKDLFHVNAMSKNFPHSIKKVGQYNTDDPELRGNWCFDTPGAVGDNQILDIFTLPELMKILPKEIIKPRSYYVKLGMTVFIGGMARIDYIDGREPIRFTVFTTAAIPITFCQTLHAEEIYQHALGTPIFGVPMGDNNRLQQFPALKSNELELEGINPGRSCADIVISCTGFVAVTGNYGDRFRLAVHTPNGKGLYCREPSLLPLAINWKGKRIRDTPAYSRHRVYIPEHISIK